VTNGVTPRRFLGLANPGLCALLTGVLGEGWLGDLDRLRDLEPLAADRGFREAWREVKRRNKERLALEVRLRAGVEVDPESLFDVQVKRFHEYKRQHLNMLHALTLYHRIRRNPEIGIPARTLLLAGKAAPGYALAKRMIRLVHAVAEVINGDPSMRGRLRVAFLPDYNVKNALPILAGADLSEQISLAGKEASGTGNMKLALNGALTIGTLDGANVEIREAVGAEHFFLFGLTVDGVRRLTEAGYRPRDVYERDEELREILDGLAAGAFSGGDRDLFGGLVAHLLDHDPFLVLADYRSYVDAQDAVAQAWEDTERWTRSSILTVARMGRFSSDRSIREYARDIWRVEPLPVPIDAEGMEPGSD
jgi:starch phosphorylase